MRTEWVSVNPQAAGLAVEVPVSGLNNYCVENIGEYEIQVLHIGRIYVIPPKTAWLFENTPANLSRKPDDT